MLSIKNVSSFYGSAQALFDVSIELDEGSPLAIIGPNGGGKSTLLDCVTGNKEFDGTIKFQNSDVADLEPWDIAADVGYSTEERNLFGDMSVEQNLRLGGYTNTEKTDETMEYVFELFPILEERREQSAKTLSGGEQQMLTISRALMTDPTLLVLDEPSLGLAPKIIKDISEALKKIKADGITLLIAEQNVTFASDHADRLVLLESGVVKENGPTEQMLADDYMQEAYFGSGSS